MRKYVGPDVCLKEASICTVAEGGKMAARGAAPSDPSGIAG